MKCFKILGRFYGLSINKHVYFPTIKSNYQSSCNNHAQNHYTTLTIFNTSNKLTHNVWALRNIFLSKTCSGKSKDKGGKDKKKIKTAKVDLRELGEIFDTDNLTNQMNKAVEDMKLEFIKNLSLRSTTGSLELIPIKMDGKDYQLQELAQIARKPKLVVLNVAAFPLAIPHILSAINKSGLNINPQQDGTTIYLPIPKVTKEHRENLSKNAKAIFIKFRDEIKDIRNKANKTLKKKSDVSEDVIRRLQNQIEIICNQYIQQAECTLESKQNELLKSSD